MVVGVRCMCECVYVLSGLCGLLSALVGVHRLLRACCVIHALCVWCDYVGVSSAHEAGEMIDGCLDELWMHVASCHVLAPRSEGNHAQRRRSAPWLA